MIIPSRKFDSCAFGLLLTLLTCVPVGLGGQDCPEAVNLQIHGQRVDTERGLAYLRAWVHVENGERASGLVQLGWMDGSYLVLRGLEGRITCDPQPGVMILQLVVAMASGDGPAQRDLVTVEVRPHPTNSDCLIFDILGGDAYDPVSVDVIGRLVQVR